MSGSLSAKTELQRTKLMSRTVLPRPPARHPVQIGTPRLNIEVVFPSRFCSTVFSLYFDVRVMIQTVKQAAVRWLGLR
jgi:hypothetical protein